MIQQLKFALRVFLKDKFYSALNILGLALGIAVSIVLLLILQNDLTYDRHHVLHERIYRLGAHEEATGVDFWTARSARELGNVLQQEFPEVLGVVRANPWSHTLVKYQPKTGEERSWYEEDVVRTDSNYFQLFTHQFIAGDPRTCLVDVNTVVLSQSTAQKYFGDDEALNKEILIGDEVYKVTGIIEDLPENSHLKFDLLLSQLVDRQWVIENGQVKSEAYWNPDVFTYILFPEGYQAETFYSKFPAIYDKYFKPFGDGVGGKYTPVLEPLASLHFSTMAADEPHGNLAYVYAFTGIGLFIILLASINYMNLSTARSVNRAGEIAMRKTLGSGKMRLIMGFLGESMLLSLAAMFLAVSFVYLILYGTSFNSLIEKTLELDFINNPFLIAGTLGLTFLIGLISGIYPAFYLPSIPTLKALKGAYKNQKGSLYLRRTLTTIQFAISIFVVVCTLFMQQQIDYVRSTDLGFDKENVVILNIQDSVVENQVEAIKTEFLRNPKITSATTSYGVPGMNVGGSSVMWAEGEDGTMKQQAFALMFVGDDYLKTMGLTLLDGRDFQQGRADADRAFIANEAAVKLMGWGDEAVGKKVRFFHDKDETKQVVGIVKDFNWNSLHNNIEPLFLVRADGDGGFLHLKVAGGDLPETMEFIRKTWTRYDTNHPYEYFFLDQEFDKQYRADEVQYQLLSGLSVICIFISLLGLLGLSAFSATQRTKEIGIRKVHGAAVSQIIYLLYKDVMILVLIAAVAVIPVSLYMIDDWMGNFAYKTNLNYLTFGVVAVLALAISFFTVAFHSLRTARTNPVESLKYE